MAIIEMREVIDSPDKAQYGATGTLNYAGYLSGHEYNPNLTGDKLIDVVDKMLADPILWGVWMFMVRPLLSATWTVEPGEGERGLDPEKQEVANWIRDCIFKKPSDPWNDHLVNFVTYLKYGRVLFEKCFAFDEAQGKWYWSRIAPRQAKTIIRWNEEEGRLVSVTQQTQIPEKGQKTGNYKTVDIPATKLMIRVHMKEGNNHEGRSLFRSEYKPWFRKDTLEAIEALAAERWGMGIPEIKIPRADFEEKKKEAYKVLANLAAHENLGIVSPDDWEFELHSLTGSKFDLQPAIISCIQQIAFSMLVQFALLGMSKSGSRAVGEVQEHPYYLAVKSVANDVEQTWQGAIEELVDFNFPGMKSYPRLKCSKIENIDTDKFTLMLKNLFDSGIEVTDIETVNFVRELVGLPQVTEESSPEAPEPSKTKPAGTKKEQEGAVEAGECECPGFDQESFCFAEAPEDWKPWRDPKGAEMFVALADIEDGHRESRQRMLEILEEEDREMVGPIASKAFDVAKSRRLESLEGYKVPGTEDMVTRVLGLMADDFRRGVREVDAELDRQKKGQSIDPLVRQRKAGVPAFEMSEFRKRSRLVAAVTGREFADLDPADYGIPADVWAYLENSARMLVAAEAAKLKRKALTAANQMILSGTYDFEALKAVINEGVREGLPLTASLYANTGFGLGRDEESKKRSREVEAATYSAILDGRVCENCEPHDGEEFDSYAEAQRSAPAPNPMCLGTAALCRCMIVLTLRREERAAA